MSAVNIATALILHTTKSTLFQGQLPTYKGFPVLPCRSTISHRRVLMFHIHE
ncbi:hypothetical protein SCLCIDRAFT_1211807 [Scleroderma citrinum Foug A]|uniref:Uncharacterized protein n=1 Tax=Scleroderma citrinum Foug A TaxID=1036808 RepID=A0A0C3ED06_9AGAM|nr:hypothetical protein SCLCIDRAFT_1211807 [Scleroderma citrinum Foug A]